MMTKLEDNKTHSITFSLNDFKKFLKDEKKVEELGFNVQHLTKLLYQQKGKNKLTITLDLDEKFVYISTIETATVDKAEKIRTSGHYFDNKLRYLKPSEKQMTIFDALSPIIKEKIEKVDYEVTAEGIHLTPPENRIITALTKLLHDKSMYEDRSQKEFYLGNHTPILIDNYGGSEDRAQAPVIKIKPAELYKAYLDSDNYSGADIKYIRTLINQLAQKKFLIRYDRKKQINKNGKIEKRTDRIEDFQALIRIVNFIPDLTEEELDNLNKGQREIAEKKGTYIIALNPIVIDQIETKYVEYPRDIEKRTIFAAGGHRKVTEAMIAFRDYMLRELSAKRTKCEIDEETLLYILKLGNVIKRRKPTLARKKMSEAIQVSKQLGLITSVNLTKGKKGQPKFEFEINPLFG